MAIINGTRFQKKEKIKAELTSETLKKIDEYCAWANIDDISYFIEEAVNFVFAKDREWKQYKKSSKKRAAEVAKA